MSTQTNLCIIGAVVAIVVMGSIVFPRVTSANATFTVTDKERIVESSGDSTTSKYLIFTETETFQNTDCLSLFKFNSSDIQGKVVIGKTYHAKVYGWRVPFMSMYRNVVSVKEEEQ